MKDLEKLKTVVTQTCIDNKSKVLIPVFALQRCQTILTCLYDMFKEEQNFNIPIIIDSPLAIKITDVFLKELEHTQPKDYKKLKEVLEACNFVSSINGGRGAVRELCDFILEAQEIEKIAVITTAMRICGYRFIAEILLYF